MSGSQDKNPFADPNYGKDLNSNGSGNPFSNPDYGKEEEKGFLGQAKDHAVSFLGKGTVALGETAVGLSNMMSDGATGKILSEKLGYDPKAAKNVMTGWQSEQYQQQLKDSANIGNRKIEEGDDFATKVGKKFDNAVDITKNAISNPSLITNNVAESLPSMLAGGVLGRALGIANPIVAGSVGEAAVMAGSQAEQIRQETVDGRLTADQSLASVGTGALGGLFGYAGGRLAQKMGLSDVDTAMQTGRLTTQQVGEEIAKTPMRAIPTAVIKGAISEGFLEELPQSVSEQILQNLALDKPWHDGVENAAVMGTLAGMAMGGTVSGVGKTGDWWNSRSDTGPQDNQQQSGSPNLPSAPSQFGSNPDSALTGEYIPREDMSQGGNQGRTAFVYDQPSMDADNLLNNNYKGDTGFDTSGNFGPSNNPDSPLSPSGGNYFDDPASQSQPQLPSERLGINPNDGPMSSAAALAVDSGASPVSQLGYAPEQQSQEQSNTPISDAVPSNYQSLLGSQNDGQPFDARFEDATVQQGNAQADNAGKSISQQYDTNAADAMGGGIETDTAQTTTAQTVQPILGQDGKNKWFGSHEKAQAFIDKKDLGNDYQVVQDGKRFEIQPKTKSPVQDDAYFQSQLDQLDKQRAQFESSGDYANAEKVYAEMQTVAREWQTNPSTDTPTTKRAEPSKGASDNAWADFYRKNRNMMSEELFMGGHQDRNALEEATPEIQSRHAHGMAKATPAAAVRDLKDILENGIDQNRGQGRLFTAPLSQGKLTAEQRSAMSASGTSSGSAYSDGAFTLIAKEGVGDIRSVSEIDAVMVNSAVPQEVVNGLRQDFPNMKFGYAKELPSLLSDGKQSNNVQTQVTELEQQLKNEKSVPKKAQIRKQIAELQNGLTEQAQSTVSLNQPQNTAPEHPVNQWKSDMEEALAKADPEHPQFKKLQLNAKHGLKSEGDRETALRQAREIEKKTSKTIEEKTTTQAEPENPNGKAPSPTEQKIRETLQRNDTQQNGKKMESAATILANQIKKDGPEYFTLGWNKDAQLTAEAHDYVETILDEALSNLGIKGFDDADSFSKLTNDVLESIDDVYATADDSSFDDRPVKDKDGNYNAPKLVKVKDEKGRTRYVLEHELNNPNVEYLRNFTESGRRSVVNISRENIFQDTPQNKQDASREIEKQAEAPKAQADAPKAKAEPEQPKAKVEPSKNTLVSDDRAAELRARLKAKLSQLNSGIDPEIMAIGAELAIYHIERGARKFAAFAKNIAADLDVSVEKIRPYLRSWYNGARDMMEDMGADIQGMDNAETVRAELAKLDNPQQQSNAIQGKTETVVTPSGREFEVQHKVVEADDLITSNLDSGAVNTEYPQALQPRDRTTLKSVTQINDIANKLNPKLLGDSASSTNGAPIVSSDNEVESGNGRTLAIRKAYQAGKADAYKAWLAEQGYDVANMQQPILVRERITPMNMAERVAYTTESNERDTLDMSPSEQAMSDAPKVMDILHLVQGGSFNNTANRDFVNAFLTGVASKNERGTMLDKDGVSLTQDGYRRIEAALLAAAFNDAQIISQVIESKDSDIKAIGNALIEVAPQWAQVRKGVQEGILVEGVNVEANLVEAVHLIRKARQQNLSLSEMLNQDDMFDGSIDQVTKDLVSIFYRGDKLDKARSSQKVAEALKSYAQLAMTAKASPNLFGDAPLSTEQILGQVYDRLKQSEAEKQQDIFSSQGNDDTGNGKPSETGQGPASSQSNAATPKSDTAVTRPTVERPKNDTTLVQDWGVQYVDGWATNSEHKGKIYTDNGLKDGVKAAFLKDSKKYLEAVQKNLEGIGYELHLDKKGKPQKVSVNESGVAGSGEVSLYIREPVTGTNVYVSIGDGRPGSHPQRIGIMYRATIKESDKQASGFGKEQSGNQYAGANTSAFELAQMIDDMVTVLVKRNQNKENSNEQPASNASNPQGASAVRGGRGRTSQSDVASGNNRNVDEGVSTRSGTSNQNQSTGRSRIRDTGTDVENDGRVSGRGMESSRREDASGTRQLPVDQPTRLKSPAAVANTATDFYMADPELIIGGTQVKRFDKNKAALELLEELTNEGRQATTEEQAILAGYTGWGSFGQDLFQGTWDKPVFKDESVWKERNLWLRERLGKESWESAKDSTINAHFTDPYTVAAMWAMAEKMGFTGGRVLEPAIGTGNFISLMPMHIKQRSQVTGIDLDITTAAIAKQLFPESNVQNMPYQKSKTPDNFYDLVISNVPFADIKIADRRYNQFNPNLHDYYFLKMLDQVRPGGIVMAITSSGTMDKQSEVIRRELAKKAELITSVRLPSGAFQEYAGTAVVTDIIVLRKRAEPLTMTPEVNWIGLSEVKTSSKPVKVNSFYAENLGNVLGDIDYGSGTTRFGTGMIVHRPHDLKQRLEKAANFVPEDALLPRHSKDHLTYYANKAGERTNTLTISDGELMFVYGDQMVKATDLSEYKLKDAKKTAQRQKSIEDLIAIRKAYTDLTDAERTEQDNVEQLRKTLNKLYQAYTKEHGPLADSFGLQYFNKLDDAYYYSLAALEVNGKPAEILKRSVVRGAAALKNPTVADAFVVERNKTAIPSLTNIAKLANVSEDQARAELIAKGAVYVLPNGDIMPSDMYLSGNVRLKLEEAQNAVAEGNTDLQRNVDALKEVIPVDTPYFNIEAKMGATWVPLSDYEKYIAHMLGMTDTTGITVTFPNGKWKVKLDPIAARRTEAKTNYGTIYKSFQTVVSAALSNQTITVKYKNEDGSESVDIEATEEVNGRITKIKEDFAAWLWSDPERRVQLEKEYNHAFNAWATPKYDGSFMSMQGMSLSLGNGPFNLRQHQQNAIWRAIVNRRSINAHEVGTGKTFTMGGIAIESRRYGIAKKPLILAHNANSAAVAKEIQMMYPSARVLFISELGKAIRQIRMRQIANDDWDVVVMPHSMIDKLTLSEETLMAMAADDIAALEAELEEALAEEGGGTLEEVLEMDSETVNKKMGFKNPTAKQLAKQRLKLLEDIQKQAMDSSKADAVSFEELGVDMILVDEVHEFKKPSFATRMNMKGLNTSSNKRSVNLQLLTRYVRRMNNGGNVHTFTGTPITNTLTEIYHQMRYVMEEEMQKLNVAAWDGWFGSFATDITDIELSATGEYQLVTRLAGFVNVPELRKMIGQFMDIVFANDMPEMQPRKTKSGKILSDESLTEAEKAELLNGRTEDAKDRPYKKVINVTTEMSPKQEQALAEIQSLAKEWEQASGKQKRQWMRDGDPRSPLSISTAAKKASYDARIGDPEYIGQEGKTEDFEMSKASQVVKNVMEVYHSHPLAGQVIFADTGYNTTTERSTGQKDANGKTIRERVKVFSPIKDIVERLVQSGIPREQIAIVDGSVKAEARKAIADKMNTGEIRVVIGLTQTLGVGVNMQRNLRAMHHLDAPWMPGELEQRNGRGLRQGNQWNTVLEYRYITDKLDGKSWQVLAIKDRFINAFMKADGNVRTIEGDAAADNGEDNGGDIMSSFSEASGDPRVLQRVKMKEKLEKLQRKERLHTQGIADMKRTISSTQRRIARFDEQIAEYEDNAVLDRIQTLMQSQSENFSVEVDGKKYDKHKEASEAIQQFIVDRVRTGSSRITLGKYGNVTMSVEWDSLQPQATLSMKIGPIEFKGNTLRGIEGKLRGAAQDVKALEDAKVSAQDTINNLSKAAEQPFGQADQLARTQKQLENIEQDLEINPVAPPIWLRRGAPIDSEVYYKGKLFIVSGHRYTNDGWFVSAEDAKGTIEIPYLEATDSVGMPIYEERVFEAPNIEDKTQNEEVKQPKETGSQQDPLYSRKSGNQKTGKTIAQVREALIKRFGKATIEALEKQGKLEIIQDYKVEGVEGYYRNGKAVLVASNLNDDTIIPTFLHELGGHAGFQNMMTPEQYADLMQQFERMVKQGNPIALEAKKLAEREQGSERQQLEYLPYLLTLASTMQQKNVLQRNALQKLIRNLISHVKAWLFDKFGINLNLNPDDMVALAERMIDKAANNSNSERPNNSAQYSLNEKSHAPFQKAIDDVVAGSTPLGYVRMGKTPDVLKMLGLPDVPVTINGATIEKVMAQHLGLAKGEHSNIHNLTPDTLRQLPKQLNNPVAVFKSGTDATKQGYVVLTELTEKDIKTGMDKPVIAALHVKTTNKGLELINIGSVYGKDSLKSIQNSLDKDLLYWHKEKGQNFVNAFRLQLPSHMQIQKTDLSSKGSQSNVGSLQLQPETHSNASLSNTNIKTNDDLVKYQEQPLYSRSSNYDDITNRIANGFKSLPKIGDWINDKGVDWLKIGLGLLSRRHLTEVYGKLLPQLNKYNELAAQMDADKNDIAAEADNIVREWSKLKDEEALANVMHEATLAQIDPAKPYQQGDNKVKYQQLHKAYNALSPEAQAMYKKARNAYSGHYAKVREAIRERILRSALSSQKKADLLQKIEGSFGQIKGVYFPLARFGKYVVVMRNQNGQAEVVSRAETYSEAKSIRSELMLKYPQFKADDVEQDAEFNASRDSVGRGFMSDLFDEVGNLGLDAKAQAEFEDTLSQLYLSSMPDLSWAKHGIHRKGTAGFSNDARRAFAQHMFSGANYLGKLRYGDQLAQQLDEMKKYSKEQFNKGVGYDQRSARSVIDEMEKRHELLMNPKGNPLSSFLTSVGFMYYMGLSPAAAMVNLSQTALIAYPIMGAKWGFDKAGKELLKASSDFAKGVEFNVPDFSSLENFKNSIGDVYSPNIDKVIKGLELDAYNKAVSRGVIDVTQAHDLAGIAQGEDSKVMWYFRPAMRLASGMFHHAERFNREVTFIAAYRLATQAGANHDTAFEQAMEAVYKGHFDYSTGNRARFLQGPVAKVLFLFKQYAQNMLYTLVRNAHQSLYALEPSERTEARRALAGILGMHALAAGAIGLPITGMLATASLLIAKKSKLGAAAFGAAALAAFFGAADGDDDDPYELEIVIRNWLADIHPKFADLVFGGVPRVFSPVDLSGRVGLSNLIIPDVQEGLEGADWATAMQSALLGPVVGISTSTAKGLQQIQEGDYGRGIETMLPIFLKNAMKSYRYADEGVLTKNKDVIHDKDVTGVELFSQAIGFSPASVRTSYEGRSAIFQYRTKLEDHRRELMRKWVVARQEDDSDGMNKVWTEILEFNAKTAEKNPKMRISRMNLMQSYKATERKAKETGDGGVYLTKRQKGAEEQGGFAFNR